MAHASMRTPWEVWRMLALQPFAHAWGSLPSGKHPEALLVIHEGFLIKPGFIGTERHLRTEGPGLRNVPGAGDRVIHHRVVVLQAGADAGLSKGCPDGKLGDAGGLFRPYREVVGVGGELFLQSLYHVLIFKKQYG